MFIASNIDTCLEYEISGLDEDADDGVFVFDRKIAS